MEVIAPRARAARLLLVRRGAPDALPAIGAWLLGAAVVGYLAMANGGYDTIVRGQVGIAVWWVVLAGAIVGALPARLPAQAWVAVGVLTAFTVLAAVSATWSESAERTVADVAKLATYAGLLLLGVGAQRRAHARHLAGGVAAAIAVVGVLSLLSRLHPSRFPVNDQVAFLGNTRRLAYPLNYWNGVAAFVAMGVPVLLAFAATARRIAVQAVAAGVIPALALTMYMTEARGGVVALGVGLFVFVLLTGDRVQALGTLAIVGTGCAILILGARGRPLVEAQLVSADGLRQGREVLRLAVIVCAGTALLQSALGLAARHATRPRWLRPTRRNALAAGLAAALVVVIAAIAAGAPGALSRQWDGFKAQPTATNGATGDLVSRLQSPTGNGRYQYWETSALARDQAPLQGTGSGTFELWWARHATTDGFVRDAHSLYMETMGELGWPGLLLVCALVALLLGTGIVRTLRSSHELRTTLAGATAAIAVFATTAAYEWVFELGAIAAALVLLGAVALAGHDHRVPIEGASRAWPGRATCIALAVAGIIIIALPVAGTAQLQASQREARAGLLADALGSARTAQRLQPYAAGPRLQEALVLEGSRDYRGALAAARLATDREPDNWRGWLVRARAEAEAKRGAAAVRSFARAKALNPRSPLFAR